MYKDIAFCHLQGNLEINMEKKLMDTATKTGIDAGDLTGNKIADKVTSVGKSKNEKKEKKDETNEVEEIYIPPEKRQKIISDLRLF